MRLRFTEWTTDMYRMYYQIDLNLTAKEIEFFHEDWSKEILFPHRELPFQASCNLTFGFARDKALVGFIDLYFKRETRNENVLKDFYPMRFHRMDRKFPKKYKAVILRAFGV